MRLWPVSLLMSVNWVPMAGVYPRSSERMASSMTMLSVPETTNWL